MALDLTEVSTKDLVAEAQRRAPLCPNGEDRHRTPMLVSPTWYVCPVCRFTVDFDG